MENVNILYLDDDWKSFSIVQDLMASLDCAPLLITTSNIKSFKEHLRRSQPKVVIIGTVLDNKPVGLNLLNWVRENYRQTKCIMLSSHREFIYKAVEWGAMSFILKEDLNNLPMAIEAVLKDKTYMPNLTHTVLKEQQSQSTRLASLTHSWMQLTKREKRIIYCQNHGYSGEETAEMLEISPEILEQETQCLCKKSKAESMEEVIERYTELISDS